MKQDRPTIAATAVQQLATTAQDASALASAPTGLWPVLLQQRLNWLRAWDETLAPLFQAEQGAPVEFALKPQQVTDLLRAWAQGLSADAASAPANSAALMLMGYGGSPQLLDASRHWAQGLLAGNATGPTHERIDQGLALARWFRRWGRQAAELVVLEALQAVSALAPQEQERLVQLGGERWKGQHMQVSVERPRVAQRTDRPDAHSLERYFKDRPEASQTLLALRAKPVHAASERLLLGGASAEQFLSALQQQAQGPGLQAQGLQMHRQPINVVDTNGATPSEAALFRSTRNAMTLLLMVTESGGIADIRLATLVLADDMSLDAYCRRVLQVNDDGESPSERIARDAVIEAVQAALQSLKAIHKPDSGSLAG